MKLHDTSENNAIHYMHDTPSTKGTFMHVAQPKLAPS